MNPDIDTDKIDDAVLALLYLTASQDTHERTLGIARARKDHDWAALARLEAMDFIGRQSSAKKAVVLTTHGLRRAKELFETLFGAHEIPHRPGVPERKVKRMNRKKRLAHARSTNWLLANTGAENLDRKYQDCFGVDRVSAAIELRALGAPVSEERIEELKRLASPPSKRGPSGRIAARRAEQEALQHEADRCWPVWADAPFPFAVDKWEITEGSTPEQVERLAAEASTPRPSDDFDGDDDSDIPF